MAAVIRLLLVAFLASPGAPPVPEAAPANDCPTYCDEMAAKCPDVFLGNRATCLATCALYPPGTADVRVLRCRIHGQADATPVPQPATGPAGDLVVRPEPLTFYDDHPQLRGDHSVVPEGYGALFLPSLGLGDQEPVITVARGDDVVAEGRPGRRVVLRPGRYTVRFGDGAEQRQVQVETEVLEGRTTVLPSTWGALRVDVVDPQFIPFRGTYELIDLDTLEVVGIGFGADELLGEEIRPWVLAPGIYKIVQAGGTYRDRQNFATVRILPGEVVQFVLVQNPDTGDFEGAGVVPGDPEAAARDWRFTGIIGGDVVFLYSDVAVAPVGWSLQLNLFFDLAVRMLIGAHSWITRLEIEESQTRPPDLSRFQNLKDRLFLHTIYTYQVVSWFGPYLRAGLETQILPRHVDFDEPTDIVDAEGTVIHDDVTRVELAGFLSPLELIQGAGGNFQVFRSRAFDLSLRLGVGARQVIPQGLQVLQDVDGGPDRLVPVTFDHVEGVEGTALGSARITRWVTLSTEVEALYPFLRDQSFVLSWRNQVNLRLTSFASLSYRFNALRNEALTLTDDLQTEHNLQLRFSYTLF